MENSNKTLRIVVDIILICVAGVFLYFGVKEAIDKFETMKVPDSVLFNRSYQNVEEDNPFEYLDDKKRKKLIEKKEDLIVFIGNPNDTWSQVLAKPLLEEVKTVGLEKIYYLETEEDIPRIEIIKEGKSILELRKEDIFKEDFDGAPIEYFTYEDNLNNFKKSLVDLKELHK